MVWLCVIYVVVFCVSFFNMKGDSVFVGIFKSVFWPIILVINLGKLIAALL